MGGFLGKLFGAPVADLVKSVGGIIDNLNTSDAEKLEAQRKLVELQLGFQGKLADLEGEWAKTQAGVITAEANSQSWMARNWRPLLMLVFTYIIAHNYVIAPIFHITSVPIPPDMWTLLNVGVGGYIGGRSFEKVAPAIATAIVTAKK
jgi:hypothetical protein